MPMIGGTIMEIPPRTDGKDIDERLQNEGCYKADEV